jgi:hypothetical protein
MARGRRTTVAGRAARGTRAVNVTTVRRAADGFLSQVEGLVAEVEALREALGSAEAENRRLQADVSVGVDIFRRAEELLERSGAVPAPRRGRRRARVDVDGSAEPGGRRGRGAGGEARPTRSRARVSPESVTPEVVRQVIARLGTASAADIAAEITRAGTPVSGRAVRHIAKAAGAVAHDGDGGRMVYSLP